MTAIEQVKQQVRSHTVQPFKVSDISCDRGKLIIADRFQVPNVREMMNALGIRENLTKDIMIKPSQNWPEIQKALASIENNRAFAGIVNGQDQLVTIESSKVDEPVPLNFDNRIDELMESIDGSDHDFHSIVFNGSDCSVRIESKDNNDIDCGLGDMWKFGAASILRWGAQQFSSFFLRLVCTNGMTTKENMQVRKISAKNIGKQFTRFISGENVAGMIKPRVDRLRKSRASFYEVDQIANSLSREDRETFCPWYTDIVDAYNRRGRPIEEYSSKQKRFVFTDQNLYDVFNVGTNLATHQRSRIGDSAAMNLNKVCGSIFQSGPNLDVQFVDIYNN